MPNDPAQHDNQTNSQQKPNIELKASAPQRPSLRVQRNHIDQDTDKDDFQNQTPFKGIPEEAIITLDIVGKNLREACNIDGDQIEVILRIEIPTAMVIDGDLTGRRDTDWRGEGDVEVVVPC